jgi:hypothetical protein
MRNLLAVLAVVLIATLTAGWCRGWYTVQLLDADPGKTAFRVEVDRLKVGNDFVDAAKAVQNCLGSDKKGEENSSGK